MTAVIAAVLLSAAYLSPECGAELAGGLMCFTAAEGDALLFLSAKGTLKAKTEVHRPTGVAASGDGGAFVTAGVAPGEIVRIAPDGRIAARAPAGHSPCAPVLSADGKSVYVAGRFTADITEYDAATLAPRRRARLLREPFAATRAGNRLFVANLLPSGTATGDVVAASVSVVDLRDFSVRHAMLPNGSTGVRGIAASPDGRRVYAVHTLGRYQLPTTQLERGWMNTAVCSVFDGQSGDLIGSFILDDPLLGAANPWGVAVSPDGKFLCVSHAGTGELSVIRRDELDKGIAMDDLSFCRKIGRRRIDLGGDGARGIAFAGGKAVVALYFDDAFAFVDLSDGSVERSVFGRRAETCGDRRRRGEMLYNSAKLCFQHWQSCASCHPDGRADGLSWDLLNDGEGNAKQTKSQIFGQFTPPTMVTGIRKDMQTCNRAGLIHIQFVRRPEEDGLCLDAYTESLTPVPSPYLVGGRLSAAAERGKKVFAKAECAACHSGPYYTDCRLYDVGLGLGTEAKRRFDTPTLREVWRTAPYLYDGRSATMVDMLTRDNPRDTHGITSGLTADEISDLAEYVLSL